MNNNRKISDWIELQLANGKYSFSLSYLQSIMPEKSENSIKMALQRLVEKKKIISIYKGFYIIIPPIYANFGLLPPTMFMDDLMKYLNRPYYFSLLTAAAQFGAAHQQPQSHYVCTILPSIRTTNKNGIRIKYVSKRSFPESHIFQKKNDSGYVNFSDPILTCLDLVCYHKTIGGYNRAATIINELSEEIKEKHINEDIFKLSSMADIQRLGFLWEYECGFPELSGILFDLIKSSSKALKQYKLNPALEINSRAAKNKWKVNPNAKIEIDE